MQRKALSYGRMQWLVVGPLLAAVLLLAALAVASVDLLSAVRAYVGGESRWSKGQKDAVYHLERYIATREAAAYERFELALSVPMGDRRARLALERRPPDKAEARSGFLAGGNHPDDVDGMVALFLRFRHVSFMAAAIDIWAEADTHIEQLATLGRRVHARIQMGEQDTPPLRALIADLPALNEQLTVLEQRFSTTLGEASRTVHQLVLGATMLLASTLLLGAILATRALLRRQALVEQNLRESNERWTLAADAAGLGLFDWDLRTQRTRIDARGAALYGLPSEAVEMEAGSLTQAHIHPDDKTRFRSVMAQAIVSPASNSIRYRVKLPDGTERHIEAIARVRAGDAGVGVSMVGTLRDVTGEVHAATLRLDKEAAERASRAKSQFLSRVSHELRTPLNAVLGFSELLRSDPRHPLLPEQAKRVQHITEAGQRLLALIDDILDLSQLDEVAMPIPLEPVPLDAVLHDAMAQMQSFADDREVRVAASLPQASLGASLTVLSERRRLSQVLHRLLSNAIKYNRPGGEVQLVCERVGAEIRLEVRDNGPGLSADQLGQLFQPFNRLGAEYSKVSGSGLGLVIAQQLLARLEGRIEVNSTEGEGTRVWVWLKAAEGYTADGR